MIRAGRAIAIAGALLAPGALAAGSDEEACLKRVAAARVEFAEDSRLLSIVRGSLDHAADLCRAGRSEEALHLVQSLRDQAGESMGQGQ